MRSDDIEVIVEIPAGGQNKYEYDHVRHVIRLDRPLLSAASYPVDYGFIPDTLAEDGDPLDALVLLHQATFPGCHITCRPVALFQMIDEHGPDDKVVCVPTSDPRWADVRDVNHVPALLRGTIEQFFSVYKLLEPGKWSQTRGFTDVDAAWREIDASRSRLEDTEQHR
ncbi:MAG TPA: inorganic diphosphatase [Acidimicrobiales bacterium]|nr:inorganic diphosphatase [Acidimicrobiales bacterium]